MMLAEIDTILVLRFALENVRCYGGPTWPTMEEFNAEGDRTAWVSSDPLAELLIELLSS